MKSTEAPSNGMTTHSGILSQAPSEGGYTHNADMKSIVALAAHQHWSNP